MTEKQKNKPFSSETCEILGLSSKSKSTEVLRRVQVRVWAVSVDTTRKCNYKYCSGPNTKIQYCQELVLHVS